MNWKKLRPILRQKFDNFHFYNDLYRSGTRRIKICTRDQDKIFNFIKSIAPELDAKLFETEVYGNRVTRVTIHYR